MTYEDYEVFVLELPGASEPPQVQHRQTSLGTKPRKSLKLAALMAKTGIDMNQMDNDDPNHDAAYSAVSPARQAESQHQRLVRTIANELLVKDASGLKGYGSNLLAEAGELAKTMKPTPRQVMAKHWYQTRRLQQEFWKSLRDAGIEFRQHSVKDFVRAIQTQLELQANGENPSVEKVLRLAFPNDEQKAKSIGNSTRRPRWKQAYESDAIKNRHVQIGVREIHSARAMQLRLSTGTFRNSLGINRNLYSSYAAIASLQQQVDSLTARVEHLEHQMQSTKLREALADGGCTTSREKVLTLRAEGMGQTEIASALDMPKNTVKSILRRSRQS